MRLNVAAKRGTDAAQELNKVDGDDSPNHVNESSAEIGSPSQKGAKRKKKGIPRM